MIFLMLPILLWTCGWNASCRPGSVGIAEISIMTMAVLSRPRQFRYW
jgi:hypothetical protein